MTSGDYNDCRQSLDDFYSVLHQRLQNCRNDYRRRLINFYSILNQKLQNHQDMKRYLDRFLSVDFNVFKVIRPKEPRLSEIIADLLDPDGPHGQRRRFLDAFLRRIVKQPIDLDSLLKQRPRSVTCERRTDYIESSQRRIDIHVEFENKVFGLGIENKPWTGDLERQLEDYIDDLEKRYGDKFCLVYLTPEGRNPSEKSIEASRRKKLKKESKLICFSYRDDILKWIEECYRLCESDKFRWFLRDFMDYIPIIVEATNDK